MTFGSSSFNRPDSALISDKLRFNLTYRFSELILRRQSDSYIREWQIENILHSSKECRRVNHPVHKRFTRDVEGMSKHWEKDVFPMIVIQKIVSDSSSDLTILRSNSRRLGFSWTSCQFSHLKREVNWKLKTIRELLFMPLTWSWLQVWPGLWVRILSRRQSRSLIGQWANIFQVSEIFHGIRKPKVPTLFFCEWSRLRPFASGSRSVP